MAKSSSTKVEAARKWLAKHPEGLRGQFIEDTGVEIGSSQFSIVRSELRRKAGNGAAEAPALDLNAKSTKLSQAEARIAYLEWCLVGERAGYIDTLLREEAGKGVH